MSTFKCYSVCIKLPLRLWLDILIRTGFHFSYLFWIVTPPRVIMQNKLSLVFDWQKTKKKNKTRISYIFLMPHDLLLISYISQMTIDYLRGQKNDMFMQRYGFSSSVVLCFQLYTVVFPVSDGANLVEIVIQVKKVILHSFKSRKRREKKILF